MAKKPHGSNSQEFDLSVFLGEGVCERVGTIVSMDAEEGIVFRYKKPRSSKLITQNIPFGSLLYVAGKVGEPGASICWRGFFHVGLPWILSPTVPPIITQRQI